ncbi:MAG: fibronectin type III domain-containing protein [Candidatus Diapherotrites archaeon]|nr:hypothetical protein [Candidatus Micrarchaeota archaeon]MBU1939580.1 hypothetical protein [Candidatus Micrarchaeota archaeon]
MQNKKMFFVAAVFIVAALIAAYYGASTVGFFFLYFAGNDSVTRGISPQTAEPGDIITISLVVDVDQADYYAFEDNLPAGWTVIDSGGMFSDEEGKIKWLVYQGAQDETKQYTTQVPQGASGTYTFSGTYIFEGGSETTIQGQSTVTVGGGPPPPPVITNLLATVDNATSSATITWSTLGAPSDSKVEYGLTQEYGTEKYSSTEVTEHTVVLDSLQLGVTYYYKATSANAVGSDSETGTFDTTAPACGNGPIGSTCDCDGTTYTSGEGYCCSDTWYDGVECSGDEDCAEDETCSNAGECDAECVAGGCAGGEIMCDGECDLPACSSNDDCLSGQNCNNEGTCSATCVTPPPPSPPDDGDSGGSGGSSGGGGGGGGSSTCYGVDGDGDGVCACPGPADNGEAEKPTVTLLQELEEAARLKKALPYDGYLINGDMATVYYKSGVTCDCNPMLKFVNKCKTGTECRAGVCVVTGSADPGGDLVDVYGTGMGRVLVFSDIIKRNPTEAEVDEIMSSSYGKADISLSQTFNHVFEITRKIEIYRTSSGSYTSQVTISAMNTGNGSGNGKATKFANAIFVEFVPKEIAGSVSGIYSDSLYNIIVDDPLIELPLGDLDVGDQSSVSYSVDKDIRDSYSQFTPPIVAGFSEVESTVCLGIICDDGNPCTEDLCVAGKGCEHSAIPDGEVCGEGLECSAGICGEAEEGFGITLDPALLIGAGAVALLLLGVVAFLLVRGKDEGKPLGKPAGKPTGNVLGKRQSVKTAPKSGGVQVIEEKYSSPPSSE